VAAGAVASAVLINAKAKGLANTVVSPAPGEA